MGGGIGAAMHWLTRPFFLFEVLLHIKKNIRMFVHAIF
jgi:hypothetical protein